MNNKLQKLLEICEGRRYGYLNDFTDSDSRLDDIKADVYEEIIMEIKILMREEDGSSPN